MPCRVDKSPCCKGGPKCSCSSGGEGQRAVGLQLKGIVVTDATEQVGGNNDSQVDSSACHVCKRPGL